MGDGNRSNCSMCLFNRHCDQRIRFVVETDRAVVIAWLWSCVFIAAGD